MRITRITVWQLTLPLKKPYRLSGGRLLFEELDSTFVRIDTDQGISGWGEGCPWGVTYLPAFGKGIRAGLAELAPLLIGRDPRRIEVIERRLDTALPGHGYVKSALDMACWDILGKATDLPLCDLLGGRTEGPVVLHSSISSGTPDEMVGFVREARGAGYRIHSAKVGGAEADLDIARIEALVADRQAGETLTFDANRAWLPAEAIQVMNAVAGAAWFEQPCETYAQCLQVRRQTRHPIILDECILTLDDLLRAQADGACEGLGLKLNRVGGLTKARRLRDLAMTAGLRLNIEDSGGSVLSASAAVQLAAATPAPYRRATWLCHDMLTLDVAPGQGARNDGGVTEAPDLPGIGVEPSLEVLGEPVAVYGG